MAEASAKSYMTLRTAVRCLSKCEPYCAKSYQILSTAVHCSLKHKSNSKATSEKENQSSSFFFMSDSWFLCYHYVNFRVFE